MTDHSSARRAAAATLGPAANVLIGTLTAAAVIVTLVLLASSSDALGRPALAVAVGVAMLCVSAVCLVFAMRAAGRAARRRAQALREALERSDAQKYTEHWVY